MTAQIISYVGHREFYKDVTYGTGEWLRGQQKIVDGATALRMSKHPDVYIIIDGDAATQEPIALETRKEDDETQYAIDSIQRMGKDALFGFVEHNFHLKLDRRKSVENLRIEAENLVHQFGIVG